MFVSEDQELAVQCVGMLKCDQIGAGKWGASGNVSFMRMGFSM
jgi:hypothetical protein